MDELGRLAGELGLLGTRAFLFHEGRDTGAAQAFRHIAELTRGACFPFTSGRPPNCAPCSAALPPTPPAAERRCIALARRNGGVVKLLEHQLR